MLDLVEQHSAQFRRVHDKSGFNLDAGAYGAIQFTQRSLEQIWLFGFAGLYSLHCYSGVILIAQCFRLVFDLEKVDGLPGQKEENERFTETIRIIEELNNAESEYDFVWPAGIPKPVDGKPDNIEQASVFDLVLMATAYVFLHELKHVIFESEGNAPQNSHDEELECDFFAFNFMMSKVDNYSNTSGYPADKIRFK